MNFKTAAALIIFFSFFTAAYAETSVKAQVDKTGITTDEALAYKLTVTSSEKELPLPQLPGFKGFAVASSAQSSQVRISAGKLENSAVYVFILYPQQTGKLKIGPSQIKIKGKVYSSEAFEIEVKQGKAKPKPKTETGPALPRKSLPEAGSPKTTL